jgi:UDP-perosamine 4-acetyltransferase
MTAGPKVVVIGAGGHAAVCIDLLLASGADVVGAVSADTISRPLQVPVIGNDGDIPRLYANGVRHAFVAIGANRARQRVTAEIEALGFRIVNAVSPDARLAPSVALGAGVAVMAGAVVNAYTNLGNGVILNTGATVDHDCVLEPFVHIAPGCHLAGTVVAAEGAFVGVGSSVVPGCRLGRWSQLGAGSVVIGDIGDEVLALGVPAHEVRKLL